MAKVNKEVLDSQPAAILARAIQKAIDGGWKGILRNGGSNTSGRYYYPDGRQLLRWRWEENEHVFSDGEYDNYESINVEAVIFNHDFAKAFFGDFTIGDDGDGMTVEEYFKLINSQKQWDGYHWGGPHFEGKIWQYHLQQMVIAEDPIKYLGENI